MLVDKKHLIVFVIWALFYCVFSWIAHIWTQWWPYFFLELNSAAAPLG